MCKIILGQVSSGGAPTALPANEKHPEPLRESIVMVEADTEDFHFCGDAM